MASAYALCKLLGLDDALALSFIPKSVTTPIAIAVSQQLGGITSITVAAVIVTGILGAITAPLMARLFRVRDASPRAWPSERAATRWERRRPSRWASSKAP